MRCAMPASRISTCPLRHSAFGRPSRLVVEPRKEVVSFPLLVAHRYRRVVVTAISTKTVGNYVSIRRSQGQQIFPVQGKTVVIKNWAQFFFAAPRACAKESASA